MLELDRSAVLGLGANDVYTRQDQAVVQAVIRMAHALKLEVIAEGGVTTAQRDTLAGWGARQCNAARARAGSRTELEDAESQLWED